MTKTLENLATIKFNGNGNGYVIMINNPSLSKSQYTIRNEVKVYLNTNFIAERARADFMEWFDIVFEGICKCNYLEFKQRLYNHQFETEALEVEKAVGYKLSKREQIYIDSFLISVVDSFVQSEVKAIYGIEILEGILKNSRFDKN